MSIDQLCTNAYAYEYAHRRRYICVTHTQTYRFNYACIDMQAYINIYGNAKIHVDAH